MADQETIVPGSPEYNAAMAAKADGVVINGDTGNLPEGGDQSPDQTGKSGEEKLLAGKFKTIEELEAAYAQLTGSEKKPEGEGDQKSQEGDEGEGQNVTEEEVKNATEDDAKDALKGVGLNFDDFSTEFSTKGELSEDSYKKLEASGIPKAMVDAYIEGQQAKADLVVEKVTGVVGGRDNYQKMIEWAQVNMTAEEIAAYDRTATQGDILTAQLAAEGLYRRYAAAVGTNNRFISGSTNAQPSDVFESTSQVTAAMRDPRYRNDPAYRKQVAEKISRSNIF